MTAICSWVRPDLGNGGFHLQNSADKEPVFHFVLTDGSHGMADLGRAKEWVQGKVWNGFSFRESVADLYILLPGSREMIRCTLTLADGEDGPELEVEALQPTVLESNVVYTCKI